MGYVYLILQINENGEEIYKLGFTKNHPNFRVKQLSTGNSNQIRLFNYYESENYKKIEYFLHKKYYMYKTSSKNEWLNLPQETMSKFIEECKKLDNTISFIKENNCFYK